MPGWVLWWVGGGFLGVFSPNRALGYKAPMVSPEGPLWIGKKYIGAPPSFWVGWWKGGIPGGSFAYPSPNPDRPVVLLRCSPCVRPSLIVRIVL